MLLFAYLSSSQALADRRRTAVVCFFVYALLITHLPLAMGVALQKDDKETESVVVTFDELKADGILGNPVGRYASDAYRTQHGLWIDRTCQLMGTPVVGEEVQLTDPMAAWEALGGADQPYVSPFNMIVAAGGAIAIFCFPLSSRSTRYRFAAIGFPKDRIESVSSFCSRW